jgi:hypothetical protein
LIGAAFGATPLDRICPPPSGGQINSVRCIVC